MFYKVLLLELLVITGLVTLRIKQHAPPSAPSLIEQKAPSATGLKEPDQVSSPVSTTGKALVFPVAGCSTKNIISYFGDKRGARLHQGIDIKAPRGTNVLAITDGFIERVREGGAGGKQVYLRDGHGRLFYYAHLDTWTVEEFEAVAKGQVLGTVGDTGNAKGTTPHLHFEIMLGKERKSIDPMEWFK